MKGHCALVLVLAVCCGLCAPTRTCDFAHAASVPEVRRRRDGQWDREGRVECAVCCLLWSFVALWVMCIAGSCCVCCGGRAVHDAGSGAACSRAEVGRRVRVACWARARHFGAMEADLGGDSGERFLGGCKIPLYPFCCLYYFLNLYIHTPKYTLILALSFAC